MKLILAASAFISTVFISFVACSTAPQESPAEKNLPSESPRAQRPTPKLLPSGAKNLLQEGAVLLDVREVDELTDGMAKGALSLPLSSVEARDPNYTHFLDSTPKEKPLIIYCKSGRRAEKVAQRLSELGYTTYNMGGFQDWKSARMPITRVTQNIQPSKKAK